jgi:DNA-binding transcriptional regulator YhcF (GntR family)
MAQLHSTWIGEARIFVDRGSSVSIPLQILGQIEYAIAYGQLHPGQRLPSVRHLARELHVSPVTIQHVYQELTRRGLVRSQVGQGSWVAPLAPPRPSSDFDELLLRVALEARRRNMSANEVLARLASHLSHRGAPLKIALVGIYPGATQRYAEELEHLLEGQVEVDARTFQELERPEALRRLRQYPLVLTFLYRLEALRRILGPEPRSLGLRMIPSQATRALLAALAPQSRLLAVSALPEFLNTLRSGVSAFTPHLRAARFVLVNDPELTSHLRWAQVVVLATGTEHLAGQVPEGVQVIEYLHTPDPAYVEAELWPVVRQLLEVVT